MNGRIRNLCLCALIQIFVYTANAGAAGLVAAYSFNEGSGTTVADTSGNGNTGTITNATWTTAGQFGGALVFNGTNALVTINNSLSLQLTTAMTLEAWVNPSTVNSAWRDLIYKGNDNYYLEGTSDNSSRPGGGGTFSSAPLYGSTALTANTWAHLALTYDGANLRLYVNGVQVASRAQTGTIATSTNPLQIGGDTIYGQYFTGTIDEVRVYNVALTAAQVQTDMNTPIGATVPDLAITKSHTGNFTQGQTGAVYTIGVNNVGSAPTSGTVTVTDTLPSGLTATAISGTGWSCTFSTLTCTRSDALAAAGAYPSITLTVNVAGNAPASVTNTAVVSGGGDTNSANNTANNVTTINPPATPDLAITKSHTGNFTQGQTGAVYTIGVNNVGSAPTSGTVTVTDTLPSGLTATAISGTGWSCTFSTLTCTRSDALAAAGAYPAITLTVNVAGNAPASVTNTAVVSGGGDANSANNTASDVTTVGAAVSGLVAAYSFNEGSGTTVADTSGNGNTGTITNATWTTAGQFGGALVFNGTNALVTINNSLSLQLTTAMTLEAWVNPSTVNSAWRDLIYKGNDNYYLEGTSDNSSRPGGGGTFSSAPLYGSTALTANTWAHLALTYDGANLRLYVNGVQVASRAQTGTIATSTNPLQIGGDTIYGQYFTGTIDEVRVYNVALTAAQVQTDMNTPIGATVPDLAITKSHTGNFTQGQTGAVYTIGVNNVGSAPTSGTVTVTDTLPSGLTATAISGTGWSCTFSTLTCTRSDALAAAGAYPSITLTVNVAGNAPASVTNTAVVSGGGDTNSANNTANNVTTINPPATPDLAITKSHTGNFTQGQTGAVYTIGVNNVGSAPTSGTVTVTDTLPSGLTATAISGTGWSCTFSTLTCTRSDALAAAGAYPAITLTVNVAGNAPASVTNTAVVSGGGDTNSANNTANNVTTINPPATPDLAITKSHTGNFTQGQTGAVYTIGVNNVGSAPTSGTVTVTDTLPSGLTATAISGTGWSCTFSTLTCTRSDALAAAGAYPAITLTVNVAGNAPASVTNTAVVSGGGDANSANNTASDVTTVGAAVSGLVAAYSFNEGSGTTVEDASGNGNTGTIINATWTTAGQFGGALVFNGTNELVTINNSLSLQLTTAMTLEAWVNSSTVNSAWRDLIYKGNDNYYLEGTSDNSSRPGGGGTFSSAPLYGTTALTANTWAHLALTYDGANLRLYVNGVQVASRAQTGAIATSTNPLQIGGDNFYGQYFQGTIDEVRVYNVALTAAQVQTDMNTPIGNIPTAPTNLMANAVSNTQINLNWTASTGNLGVSEYFVERCQGEGCSDFSQIATPVGTTYSDITVIANTNYSYRVRATDTAGDLSPYSNVASAYTGLSISPGKATLTFTQTQQFTASGPGITSVIWSVDGVQGGTVSSGTITASGLYSPPGSIGTHTVTATTLDQSQSVNATVYIVNYLGTFTHHNDNFRTGQNLNETILTPTNVNSSQFGKLFSYPLDQKAYASPLYVANVNVPGKGFHNVVYVATEHDSVYAFDADGLSSSPLWQTSFINPAIGVTTVPAADTGELFDIAPEIGITGTPVIDPVSGTLYVVAKTKEVSGGTTNYVQRLHALDISDGTEKFGGPVLIQATVHGTGTGSQGGLLPFLSLLENQRPALLLSNGVVYVGFASHGDNPPYHGWVFGFDAKTLQQVMVYNASANGDAAGIWHGGGGLAADSSDNIYAVTGNGTFDANTGGVDFGDSYLKINSIGNVLDYFTPHDQDVMNAQDLDLGSAGVLLLPDQSGSQPHLLVSAGKTCTIYLINRDNMGHYNANNDNIVQSITNAFPDCGPETGNRIPSVYFNGYVYFSSDNDYIKAFQLSNGLLSMLPTSQSSELYTYPGGSLAISANGNNNGILWSLQRRGPDASGDGVDTPGVLRAYDPNNLNIEYYNSDQAGSRDTMDYAAKFNVPLVANGKVYVVGETQLTVYGLLP